VGRNVRTLKRSLASAVILLTFGLGIAVANCGIEAGSVRLLSNDILDLADPASMTYGSDDIQALYQDGKIAMVNQFLSAEKL